LSSGADLQAVISPVPREVWETVLKSDGDAVVSQSLAWRDSVLDSGKYVDASRLYEFGSGHQVVLPLVRRRNMPVRLATVGSWPRAWGAGGPICADGHVTEGQAAAVMSDVASLGAVVTEIRLRHGASQAWQAAAAEFTSELSPSWDLDLCGGFDAVWSRKFRSSFRQAVRKAERSGLEVEVDHSGRLLGEFWDLYRLSMVRWAQMQHAPVWLTRRRLAADTNPGRLAVVAKHFGQDCATWVARSGGQPVAAIIVLRFGGYAKYWRGAMDKDGANKVRANELLHRLAIEEACKEGYRFYDLGFARPESPLAAFKAKFGADLRPTQVLRAERLPVQAIEEAPRKLVKKVIRFSDNT
jgi:CelD/BcsL family acetyltransferase involved in cellulose biosynthesis